MNTFQRIAGLLFSGFAVRIAVCGAALVVANEVALMLGELATVQVALGGAL